MRRCRLYEGVIVRLYGFTELFYVKGIQDEDGKYIILPRYVPHRYGSKVMPDGARYMVLKSFSEQIRYVKSTVLRKYLTYSYTYGQVLPLVPEQDVASVFDPIERALEIRLRPRTAIEHVAAELLDVIYAYTSKRSVGVSGSLLAGFVEGVSDVDIVVIDVDDGEAVLENLAELKRVRPSIFDVDKGCLYRLYMYHRETVRVDYETFLKIWSKRVLEGFYRGVPYFIRILAMRDGVPIVQVQKTRKLGKISCMLEIDSTCRTCLSCTTPSLRLAKGPFRNKVMVMSDRGVFTDTLDIVRKFNVTGIEVEYSRLRIDECEYEGLALYLGPGTSMSPVSLL